LTASSIAEASPCGPAHVASVMAERYREGDLRLLFRGGCRGLAVYGCDATGWGMRQPDALT
jgi:hypothetical protein